MIRQEKNRNHGNYTNFMKITVKIFRIQIILIFFCACNTKTFYNENSNDSWTIFRGNSALTGYTEEALPKFPFLLWTFKSNVSTKSSPVVYNSVAYWCSKRGRIFGIDRNGKQVFDYDMKTAVDATPLIHDSVIYLGRVDGFLYAISLITQDTLWTFETFGQISASPNKICFEKQDAIIIGSYDNYLYSIDSKTGKQINRFESGYYINGAVAKYDNYVVFGGCDGFVRVIDCLLGKQIDSLDVEIYIPASPAIRNNNCYIADHIGNVYEILLEKGRIVSSKKIIEKIEENHTLVSVPAVSDKMLFMIYDNRYIFAINRKDGKMAWKYLLKGDTGESSPVICKDKLLACTKTGIISIHNALTGELLWEYDTGEQITASPAVIKGFFYVLSNKGTLFCFGEKN